jgi:glyoxylase-like metal-dependent hydrolase (beta-lactamase superfamily II)
VPWYLHSGDFRIVGWGNDLLTYFGLPQITVDDVRPTLLDVQDTTVLPGVTMKIIETPGHTPGGVAYYFPDEHVMIIGDTLFQESIGRYDLPGGDKDMLFKSISNIYNMNLPNDVEIIHGHGMATDIEYLHKNNPYFHE